MKKSPLNTPSGPSQQRHNWNSYENANKKSYHSVKTGNYQSPPANNGLQAYGDDFIPLNVSTPMTQHKRFSGNWYRSEDARNNAGSSGRGNYRNNYHAVSRSNYNSSYSPYKHSNRQFYGQRKGNRGGYRQPNISEYINMSSFLEDPWKNLIKSSNSESENESEIAKIGPLSNVGLTDSDPAEKFGSKFAEDINLDDTQYSREAKVDSSMDTSFETEDINVSQTSKNNSSLDLDISTCSVQKSLDESTCSINDSASEITEKKHNICSDEMQANTEKENI